MKKSTKNCLMAAFCAAVSTVVGVGTAHGLSPFRPLCLPGQFECLDVWDPVICSNGVVYSNFCYAARACATGCVRWGGDIY